MTSNLSIAQRVSLINPQDESYRSISRMMGQNGTGMTKDLLKAGKKVARDTQILSKGARALAPMATTLAESTGNPALAYAVKQGIKEGVKQAEKRGFGLTKDLLKAGKKVARDTQIISKSARALAPMATTLAESTGNPALAYAVKQGIKEGIKQAEKKGYGKKRKSKR